MKSAGYPGWLQNECTGSAVEYSPLSNGKIQVILLFREGILNGPLKDSKTEGLVFQKQLLDHQASLFFVFLQILENLSTRDIRKQHAQFNMISIT
jgi:hypothetical protein